MLKRIQANGDTPVDYLIGADLISEAAGKANVTDGAWLRQQLEILRTQSDSEQQRAAATDPTLLDMMAKYAGREFATEFDRELVIVVDPVSANSVPGMSCSRGPLRPMERGTARSPIARLACPMSRPWDSISFTFHPFTR